jgi:phospholipid/cholesterol/gamma-HCH transport system substrate-binding protein/paraquat-inducible protein B
MATKQSYFKLGLFVLAASALLFVSLFLLGGRSLFEPRYIIETYFNESVSGLDVGAPVKFRGVPVGQVSQITMASRVYADEMKGDPNAYILVRMRVSNVPETTMTDLATFIKKGLRVQTQLAGVTGQLFLGIDFLDPEKNPPLALSWTPEYPYIPSAPSLTNEIIANAQRFLASLDNADIAQLGQNLNRLAVTFEKRVNDVPIDKLAEESLATLRVTRETIGRIDRALAQAKLGETFENLRTASARLDRLLADPALESTPRDVAVVAARLRRLAESGELDTLLRNATQAVARVDGMLGANQYDLRVAIEDLRASMDNLRAITELARRNPAGLIFSEPPRPIDFSQEKK